MKNTNERKMPEIKKTFAELVKERYGALNAKPNKTETIKLVTNNIKRAKRIERELQENIINTDGVNFDREYELKVRGSDLDTIKATFDISCNGANEYLVK